MKVFLAIVDGGVFERLIKGGGLEQGGLGGRLVRNERLVEGGDGGISLVVNVALDNKSVGRRNQIVVSFGEFGWGEQRRVRRPEEQIALRLAFADFVRPFHFFVL